MNRDSDTRITYNILEVAAQLGISKTLAYEMANRGELPAVRLGRRLVVPRRALEAWLDTAVYVVEAAR